MNQPLAFHPDILQRFELFNQHTSNKHKVVMEFHSILKGLCEIEEFYSRNLDKLAQSISKLIIGKDTLKEVFIVFERMLAARAEEARLLADSIKNDMMPFTKSITNEQNYQFRASERRVREVRSEMEKKHKGLQLQRRQYLRSYGELTQNSSLSAKNVKEQLKLNLQGKERELVQFVNDYNRTVQGYLTELSELTNNFTESEQQRKRSLKSSVQKFMIFEMSAIKNMEYNIDRYCKSMDAMDDKLAIADRNNDINERVPLARISPHNYLEYLKAQALQADVKKARVPSLRSIHQRYQGRVDQNRYKEALKQIYPLLDHLMYTRDVTTLKKVLKYCETVYKQLPDMEMVAVVTLNEGLYCHDIFRDRPFWESYTNGVLEMLQRENGSMSSLQDNGQEQLEEEIRFVRCIRLDEQLCREFFTKVEGEMTKMNYELRSGAHGAAQVNSPVTALQTLMPGGSTEQLPSLDLASKAAPNTTQVGLAPIPQPSTAYTAQEIDAFM